MAGRGIKTLALIKRRADHTRDAFRDHYEDIHAPLAMETVLEGTQRYIRHHIREELFGVPDFDVVTAFWYPSAEAAQGLMERLAAPVGERIIADEHSFMDRPANTFFAVAEETLRGAEDREAGLSVVALIRAGEGTTDPAARADFLAAFEAEHVPSLLDASKEPRWLLQNRALGPAAWDCALQLHAAGDAGLAAWGRAVEASGARALVLAVSEHETETPW